MSRSSLSAARLFEQTGDAQRAFAAYLQAQAYEDAARILTGLRRYDEAATLLMRCVTFVKGQRANTPDEQRIFTAIANCYSRSGRHHEAAQLLLAAGDSVRAAAEFERAGERIEAARALSLAPPKSTDLTFLGLPYASKTPAPLPAPALPREGALSPEVAALERVRTLAFSSRTPAITGPIFSLGDLVAQRYRLEEKLGDGGMATVFKATDLELNEHIALKLFTQPISDTDPISRFKQELKLSRKLNHPNIVRLFDFGIDGPLRFITMELLEGHDLRVELAHAGGRMSVGRTLHILTEVLAGLHEAHTQGVVHRDIKPENLFVLESGRVKVMDFGIAKGHLLPNVTAEGMLAGTPIYIAPDQVSQFTTVTHAADQYSLGIVAFELLSGRPPFHHSEVIPLLMMHLHSPPPTLASVGAAVPPELDDLVQKMLAKRPEDRFLSCYHALLAVNQLSARLGIELR